MKVLLEKKDKSQLLILFIVFIFVLLLLFVLIFGKLNIGGKQKDTVATVLNDGDLVINYIDGEHIKFNDTEEHNYSISITNSSENKIFFSIYFIKANSNDMFASISDKEGNVINEIEGNLENKKLINLFSIAGGETLRYSIIIKSDKKVNFNGELKVVNESNSNETFADLLLTDYEIREAKTRVGEDIATEEEGLVSTIDNRGNTYYFRGSTESNYVKIGNNMFRIVRINGNGTVRLVLDGIIETRSAYNSNLATDEATVSGYSLLNDSTIKNALNDWYNANLGDYDSYIAESDFCTDNSFNKVINDIHYSNSYERIYVDRVPDLYCSGSLFGAKVGLLSADEVLFAGAVENKENNKYYLYNQEITDSYYTLSSHSINSLFELSMITVNPNGSIENGTKAIVSAGIRPVISLGLGTKVKGNGTEENPYIIVS
jgi:hypothetical protein